MIVKEGEGNDERKYRRRTRDRRTVSGTDPKGCVHCLLCVQRSTKIAQ
jgi:hypothetical protein